jgi:hypothetical protein
MKGVDGNVVELNYEEGALHDTFLLGAVLGFEESARNTALKAGKFIKRNQCHLQRS